MMNVITDKKYMRYSKNGRNLPKGFQSKSKFQLNPPSPNTEATPLPTVGFFKNGF